MMGSARYIRIDGVLRRLKNDLDNVVSQKPDNINIITLFAHNGTGKTRLSNMLQKRYSDKILCYNSFMEDFFTWDNENAIFNININSWLFDLIKELELEKNITENFQELVEEKIDPTIDFETGDISFNLSTGDDEANNNIKISRGEESLFLWSVFYTILKGFIENQYEGMTDKFNDIEYIIIDDPVSSMDDKRIINIALKVVKLISKSNNKLKFLITTHHALFFNVLLEKNNKKWNKSNYVLYKKDNSFNLKSQGSKNPHFTYHNFIKDEIKLAIEGNSVEKYHFNLFRTILEKTAGFFGYEHWKNCLVDITDSEDFLKIIDHYSHDKLSDLEHSELIENEKETFKEVFEAFLKKYSWGN